MLELQTGTRRPSGWFAPSAGEQVRRFLIESSNRERAASYCALQKTAGRSEPADRRPSPADAPARRGRGKVASPLFTSGNAKLTEENEVKKNFLSALEIN